MNHPAQRSALSVEQKENADLQARFYRHLYDYDTKDYTVGSLLAKVHQGELILPPDYHREPWDERHQCLLIESIFLELPIPLLLLADCPDGRLEIVDGVQRIRAIAAFQDGTLRLTGLDILTALSGFLFADLSDAQQRRFLAKPLRVVVFDRDTPPASRRDVAHRMNQPRADGAEPCGT